jgi:hypothetical protein
MRARRAFQARVEDVARRRGQWPLPAAVGGLGGVWRRMRASVRSWRESLARNGGDLAGVLGRAEGMFMAVAPGLQAALVGVTAAGALMIAPAAASTIITSGAAPLSTEARPQADTPSTSFVAPSIDSPATTVTTVARPVLHTTTKEIAPVRQAPTGSVTYGDESDGDTSGTVTVERLTSYVPVWKCNSDARKGIVDGTACGVRDTARNEGLPPL